MGTAGEPSQAARARAPSRARLPGFLAQSVAVARKDLRIELATGEIVTTAGFFAVLVAIIASLAFFGGKDGARDVAPGVIWISVTFASVLALSRTWQREREDGAIKGLLVAPVRRGAIFLGKALGVAAFVLVVALIIVPVTALLFQIELGRHGLPLLLLLCAAIPGIAASGTLFGAMTIRTKARDLILATVMLPLLSPSVLTGVAGTRALLTGSTLGELGDYFSLLGVFGFVFVAGGLGLFEAVLEG